MGGQSTRLCCDITLSAKPNNLVCGLPTHPQDAAKTPRHATAHWPSGIVTGALSMTSVLCPITLEVFIDPVVAADGHTYERGAIQEWFKTSNMSPVTGLRLPSGRLMPNHVVRMLLAEQAATAHGAQTCASAALRDAIRFVSKAGVSTRAVLHDAIRFISKAAVSAVLALSCLFGAWFLSLYVCEATLTLFRALAPESNFPLQDIPLLITGTTLCLCGVMVSNERLALVLVVAGTPLAIVSFCQGVWALRGGDAEKALFMSRCLVCAGLFFSSVGIRLVQRASHHEAGAGSYENSERHEAHK